MKDASLPQRLEQRKRASVAQLLMKAGRLVDERALERWRERSDIPIRRAHTALFPHLDLAGTRLTTLAERVGTSKQAVAQLVDDLVAWGSLERIPDPQDGRAKLIVFAKGGEVLFEGLALLGEFDERFVELLGAPNATRLQGALEKVIADLER
jgi:DNA-binding MarR family transcriptional regulator